jgi:hypothetical protein
MKVLIYVAREISHKVQFDEYVPNSVAQYIGRLLTERSGGSLSAKGKSWSGLLFLSQQNYVKKVFQRFNMHDAKSVSTPIAPHFKLSTAQCPSIDQEIEYMSRVPYSSVVGSLMYVMVCSRPDLSYAMSLVSKYISNPGKEHCRTVQWIFRYLRGTTDFYLKFGRTDKGLIGYMNSDYAVDLDRRRSFIGYVFTVGSCAVSWRATLQSVVSLSTTEEEYMVVSKACKELIWLKGLYGIYTLISVPL